MEIRKGEDIEILQDKRFKYIIKYRGFEVGTAHAPAFGTTSTLLRIENW